MEINNICVACKGTLTELGRFGFACDYCVTLAADQLDEDCDGIVRRLRRNLNDQQWYQLECWVENRRIGIGTFKHEAVIIVVEAMHLLCNNRQIEIDKFDLPALDANLPKVIGLIVEQLAAEYSEPAQALG
ncbi:MAG: hypothetical protein WEC81_01880 [Patescibacteria group bacterium]